MNKNESSEVEKKLVKELIEALKQLKDITEYKVRELNAISILSMNPFMKRFFTSNPRRNLDLVSNKKHLKRKYEKTLIIVIKSITRALGQLTKDSKLLNLISKSDNDSNLSNLLKRM